MLSKQGTSHLGMVFFAPIKKNDWNADDLGWPKTGEAPKPETGEAPEKTET